MLTPLRVSADSPATISSFDENVLTGLLSLSIEYPMTAVHTTLVGGATMADGT